MKVRDIVLVACTICSCCTLDSYPQINSFREVKELFDSCGPADVIFFDVDDTLTISVALDPRKIKNKNRWLVGARKTIDAICCCCCICDQDDEGPEWREIVGDEDIVDYIQKLQRQKCRVYALTGVLTSPLGSRIDLPMLRYRQLLKKGFTFSKAFKDDYCFYTMPTRNIFVTFPRLIHGILCTNGQPKGAIATAFLRLNGQLPNRVIFFDDLEGNLASVEQACKALGVSFLGFQCIGCRRISVPSKAPFQYASNLELEPVPTFDIQPGGANMLEESLLR